MSLPRVIELELWSLPGASGSPLDGKAVAESCRAETGLSPEVVLGLNFVPDTTDVTNLRSLLDSAPESLKRFRQFFPSAGYLPIQPK